MPEAPGTYKVCFRLSGDNGKFGQRLCTVVEIEYPSREASPEPVPPMPVQDSVSSIDTAVTFTSEPAMDIPSVVDDEPSPVVDRKVSVPAAVIEASAPPPQPQYQFPKE